MTTYKREFPFLHEKVNCSPVHVIHVFNRKTEGIVRILMPIDTGNMA